MASRRRPFSAKQKKLQLQAKRQEKQKQGMEMEDGPPHALESTLQSADCVMARHTEGAGRSSGRRGAADEDEEDEEDEVEENAQQDGDGGDADGAPAQPKGKDASAAGASKGGRAPAKPMTLRLFLRLCVASTIAGTLIGIFSTWPK